MTTEPDGEVSPEPAKRGRGRPPRSLETRADGIRQERRRKAGSTVLPGIKLGVDESKLDRANFEYRFVNDSPGRVQQMFDEDWDPVNQPVKTDSDGLGTVQGKVVGTHNGAPLSAILMKKRKDWYDADQKEKQRPLEEADEQIRRGVIHQKQQDTAELAPGLTYTPGGRNTVSR